MATPTMDDLQLSDSDIDVDSPTAAKHHPHPVDASPPASPSGAPKPQRAESRYTTEEARDAALRHELDQVRGVNKVIEDVIESLEKAKNNMNVSPRPNSLLHHHDTNPTLPPIDRQPHRHLRLDPPPNLDPHPLHDRAQPTPHPRPQLAGRHPGRR